MPRQKEPVALILAKGKTHLTQADIQKRQAEEITVPFTDIKPPKELTTKQKRTFRDLAGKLARIGIYTELDAGTLARYIVACDLYTAYTEAINQFFDAGNLVMLKEMQGLQDKAFRQAQLCARDLGLTITSRCRLAMPAAAEAPKKNKFEVFEGAATK